MNIRRYQTGEEQTLWLLFYNTIHQVNCRDYSPAQIEAWAPSTIDPEQWRERLINTNPFIAEENGEIVGFAELEDNGHIDCFYCAYNWQGKGVGSSMLQTIEFEAAQRGITLLFTEASITAKEFFARKGFRVDKEQIVKRRGEQLTNYAMSKRLTEM